MIVKQIRYYNEDDKQFLNSPDISAEKLVRGDCFENIYCDEIQIKTYPGTILEINGEEVHIGETGVYNILYREGVSIHSLKLNEASIEFIRDTDNYFIITFILHEDNNSFENNSSSSADGSSENPTDEGSSESETDSSTISSKLKDNHDN